MWRRFDIVRLTTTRNISFLSGPPGRPASPQGNWSIVGNLPGAKLMIAKDETIAVVPLTDVRKIGEYNIDKVIENIKKVKSKRDLGEQDGEEKAEEE